MTKRSFKPVNLDEKVVFTSIISGVLSIALLFVSFRYNNEDLCTPPGIYFSAGDHYAGDEIEFKAVAINAPGNIAWHFGDTGHAVSGDIVYHAFKTAGFKKISLTVSNMCKKDTVLYLLSRPDPSPQFSGPASAVTGKPVIFRDSTPNAVQWQWRFDETDSVDAIVAHPVYSFKEPGIKTVSLVVNGRMHGEKLVIVETPPANITAVSERRGGRTIAGSGISRVNGLSTDSLNKQLSATKPLTDLANIVPPKLVVISGERLSKMLLDVIDGKIHHSDFTAFFCHPDTGIPVQFQNNKITFKEFCDELKGIGKSEKVKRITVSAEKDPITGCLKSMTVDIRKKSGFQRIKEKIL